MIRRSFHIGWERIMETTTPDYLPFMRMWMDMFSKMPGGNGSAETFPTDAARQMRDNYLQSLSRQSEEFMRSPQFLDMMKQSTDAAIAFRQQVNEMLVRTHHALGGVAKPDVDGLLMAVRRCETRVLDKLDELSARIETLEKAQQTNRGKTSRKTKRTGASEGDNS